MQGLIRVAGIRVGACVCHPLSHFLGFSCAGPNQHTGPSGDVVRAGPVEGVRVWESGLEVEPGL